ncbi:hypothetical protein SAMN05421877_10958 [Sphingobacterium lactis]|uniref:Uncharacterized protein n=1 Tax=Sphingobacterium lactis TaxID=797291 RepID=A0A1H6AZB0_9SPHI|nr:hypothetical protein SAMN05421877_10958 [Sphingobacterium lactis]
MLSIFDYFCQQEFKISTKITFIFHFEGFKLFFPFSSAFHSWDVPWTCPSNSAFNTGKCYN